MTKQQLSSMDGQGAVTYIRQVKVGEFDVPVSIREDGPGSVPLLLLHATGTEFGLWGRFRELLGRTTIAFDVKGPHLGRGRPSVRAYAEFITRVLSSLGVDRVDVLGLSWGGIAAQQLAHDHPGWVRRVVLVGTSPGFISLPARPASTRALLTPHRDASHMPTVIRRLYKGDFVDNPGLVAELGLIRTIDEATYIRQLWAIFGWTSVHWLPSIRKKVLILHGDDDPIVPYVNALLMRRLIRESRMKKIQRGGHLFILTRPEETARTVAEFLDQPDNRAHLRLGVAPDEDGLAGSARQEIP